MLNSGQSPIRDAGVNALLRTGNLELHATIEPAEGFSDADLVVVATPDDVVIVNRINLDLADIAEKVCSRDIFSED